MLDHLHWIETIFLLSFVRERFAVCSVSELLSLVFIGPQSNSTMFDLRLHTNQASSTDVHLLAALVL